MLNLTVAAILGILTNDLNTLLVAAAGNDAVRSKSNAMKRVYPNVNGYPAKFLQEGLLKDMIVVGATDRQSRRAAFSQKIAGDESAVLYAPGMYVGVPAKDPPLPGQPEVWSGNYGEDSGTSLGMDVQYSALTQYQSNRTFHCYYSVPPSGWLSCLLPRLAIEVERPNGESSFAQAVHDDNAEVPRRK